VSEHYDEFVFVDPIEVFQKQLNAGPTRKVAIPDLQEHQGKARARVI